MPENAGGSAAQTTSILRFSGDMCTKMPTASIAIGIMTSLRNVPIQTWLFSSILTDESVMPAANTATEALAPARSVNDGSRYDGHLTPQSTRITARIGAHATGCLSAFMTGPHGLGFLPPLAAAAASAFPALRRQARVHW